MTFAAKNTLAACLVVTLSVSHLRAQNYMGRVLKKELGLRLVSCSACHPKEEDEKKKDKLTPFGQQVGKLLRGSNVTERLEEAEEKGKEEEDRVEQELEREFLDVLKKLGELKAPSGKTYIEAIRAGEIDGIKPRTQPHSG